MYTGGFAYSCRCESTKSVNLSPPSSNYEVQANAGRNLRAKSLGTHLKGRGNVGVKVLDDAQRVVLCLSLTL